MQRKVRVIFLIGALVGVAACLPAFAQGRLEIVPLASIKWVACDPSAAQPDACEFGNFRGDPEKEPNFQMVRAKKGFVFPPHWHHNNENLVITKGALTIAAEGGQEHNTILRVGDYIFIPARRVHWASCLEDCVFYLNVDGPDSYIDAKEQRP